MAYMIEEKRQIDVTADCDVLVVGGGIAGVSAAIAAARNGEKVILLEREFGLGGLATLGLIVLYLPLCDGEGTQVSYGLAEELLRLSICHGAQQNEPTHWLNPAPLAERKKSRYMTQFNPNYFALELEKLLGSLHVQILYGTVAAAVHMQGKKIDAVIVESKSGRSAITAGAVIDATGDADICKYAAAPTALYEKKNGLASWYYYDSEAGGAKLKMFGLADVVSDDPQSATKNETVSVLEQHRYTGVDSAEVSQMVLRAHEKMLDDILQCKQKDERYAPVSISSIPLLRMTRRLKGCYDLDDTQSHEYFSDSIGMIGDWRKRGPVYEIPFACLHCAEVDNLLAAGRNISVTDAMWDISRVIPACAITGEAAGTAASITKNFNDLDTAKLQDRLVRQGVILHWNDLQNK